jgi:hypothetical protein
VGAILTRAPSDFAHFVKALLVVKAAMKAPALAGTPPASSTPAYLADEKIGQKMAMGISCTTRIYPRTIFLSRAKA